jgi:hypothetical protein
MVAIKKGNRFSVCMQIISLAYVYLIDVQDYHIVGKAFRIMEHNVYA